MARWDDSDEQTRSVYISMKASLPSWCLFGEPSVYTSVPTVGGENVDYRNDAVSALSMFVPSIKS